MESNKNYTVNVTVNKTGVSLTASLTDWDNTSLSELTPVIVAGVALVPNGTNGTMGSFDLYRSTTNINYDENTTTTDEIDKATTCTQAAGSYTMNPQIYWPDHTTFIISAVLQQERLLRRAMIKWKLCGSDYYCRNNSCGW